jgi:predicted nucleic acid-binding protein
MRIVVDTNIAFSAILNTNSKIARIILQPKSRLNFYSTDLLMDEIQEHKTKLKHLANFTDFELNKTISLITHKIRFIDAKLIPEIVLIRTQELLQDIDIDDTEFVALADHIHGKLWSGDKVLHEGLKKKKWTKFISTTELYAGML